MEIGQVRPTMSEWVELPNTVRQAVGLCRRWRAEMEREAQEEAERRGRNR